MPWSQVDRPSAAISALASYVRKACPDTKVTCLPAYVDLATRIGFEIYDLVAQYAYRVGEPIYASLLYPSQRPAVLEYIVEDWGKKRLTRGIDWRGRMPGVLDQLDQHVGALAEQLAEFDVVGMTTCFGQLFANLNLSRRIKELNPGTTIVIGGSTVSSHVGPSVLDEYPFVDYIIQGEGERPLVTLLHGLATEPSGLRPENGILSRASSSGGQQAALQEVPNMDALPLPDYDAYAALAKEHDISWALPIEGSRGCWWDRTKRKGNPRATCYFCNLNVQWGGYREKGTERLVEEVVTLSTRYENTRLFFVDNIMRTKGADELAGGLEASGSHFDMFYELRANIKPFELVRLWEAGLSSTQFGIESLSDSLLKKVGKGTSVIENLQAMKICAELGISNGANLIVNFPGSTNDEVAETTRNIMLYALPYEPLQVSTFQLGLDSTVAVLWKEFGVSNVRNADEYKIALPPDVWARLRLFELDYDPPAEVADWGPVLETCARWREINRGRGRSLFYRDGSTFMQIFDESGNGRRELVLRGLSRDVYMYCCNTRTWNQIVRKFSPVSEAKIAEVLAHAVETHTMYSDGDRFLSLAMAPRPIDAAIRIRKAAVEDGYENPRPAPAARAIVSDKPPAVRLPVLA
jgi:ribosomal peptide maturation radical SAM protein 1